MTRDDDSEWTISEISKRLSTRLADQPTLLDKVLQESYRKTATLEGPSYDSTCDLEDEPWIDVKGIRRVHTPEIERCRRIVIEGEVHHQFGCRFAYEMLNKDILQTGKLPRRIGLLPELRAASRYMTMMTNHELMLYHFFAAEPGAKTHNTGMEMSTRYYVTENSAVPFLRYEAKVLVGLGLWHIIELVDDERRRYRVQPGPCLPDYMRTYWKIVDWANDLVGKALDGK